MKIIGIDTGVHTGIAVVENGKLSKVTTTTIARALEMVKALAEDNDAFVVVEDARLRKWYKPMSREQERQILQGVGSVKRDAEVWEDFLQLNNIPHRMQAPKKGCTKYTSETFKRVTGWTERTNEHSRDAAMLAITCNPKFYKYERKAAQTD
jgi:hypothetical protein